MDRLTAVETFALGPVGPAALPSTGETLTRELARRADAVDAFTSLVGRGNPVARLYAYWALRTLAPERARAYAASIEADPTMVATQSGYLGDVDSVGSLARRMRDPADALGRVAMRKP